MADFPMTEDPAFSATMERVTNKDRAAPDTFNTRYQVLLDNDNHLKKEVGRIAGEPVPVTLLASGWSAAAPYIQTVAVAGITAGDSPILVKLVPDNATPEQVKAYNKAFGMIDSGDTGDGTATFKCYDKKPTADLTVGLKGV